MDDITRKKVERYLSERRKFPSRLELVCFMLESYVSEPSLIEYLEYHPQDSLLINAVRGRRSFASGPRNIKKGRPKLERAEQIITDITGINPDEFINLWAEREIRNKEELTTLWREGRSESAPSRLQLLQFALEHLMYNEWSSYFTSEAHDQRQEVLAQIVGGAHVDGRPIKESDPILDEAAEIIERLTGLKEREMMDIWRRRREIVSSMNKESRSEATVYPFPNGKGGGKR